MLNTLLSIYAGFSICAFIAFALWEVAFSLEGENTRKNYYWILALVFLPAFALGLIAKYTILLFYKYFCLQKIGRKIISWLNQDVDFKRVKTTK